MKDNIHGHKQERILLLWLDWIDFYCFKHHFNVIKKCVILPVSFSDHCLVECSIYIANIKPKSAYWHFNVLLLQDKAFIETFTYFWKQFGLKKHAYRSLRQWWDYGKVEIQQLCRQYTLNVSREISRSMRNLEIEIVELQNSAASTGNRGAPQIQKEDFR
jgi:hypothetical protein